MEKISKSHLIASIRDSLQITMSDFANILGVDRPSAYALMKGEYPATEALVDRLERLAIIADRLKALEIERLDKLIDRPVAGQESLLQLLKQGQCPSEEFLLAIKEVSGKEAETRRSAKGSGLQLRSMDEVLGESFFR